MLHTKTILNTINFIQFSNATRLIISSMLSLGQQRWISKQTTTWLFGVHHDSRIKQYTVYNIMYSIITVSSLRLLTVV